MARPRSPEERSILQKRRSKSTEYLLRGRRSADGAAQWERKRRSNGGGRYGQFRHHPLGAASLSAGKIYPHHQSFAGSGHRSRLTRAADHRGSARSRRLPAHPACRFVVLHSFSSVSSTCLQPLLRYYLAPILFFKDLDNDDGITSVRPYSLRAKLAMVVEGRYLN